MPPLSSVGPYPIERVLGHGGAGIVYLARHPSTGARVAIKTILAGRMASPRLLQRFQSEAQALARLRHPHLVPLLDSGIERGVPFLVLEFVEGLTLEAHLAEHGPMDGCQAAETVRSLATAVHYAHLCKVVHRDLKPANVLLRPSGEAVLTDFGLALHLDMDGRLSTSGVCQGTPGFWSPEQARGDLTQIGPASDVYGLGALLFACLTGEPPIQADSLQAYLDATLEGHRTPPSSVDQRVDPRLDAIVARCMALEPADRYPSAESVASALTAYLEAAPVEDRAALPVLPLVLGALVLALTVALAVVLTRTPGTSPEVTDASPTALPQPAPTRSPASSPTPSSETPPAPVTPVPPPSPAVRAPEDPAQAEGLARRAGAMAQSRRFSEAVKLFNKALAMAPSHPQRLVWIGMRGFCHRESGAYRDAVHDLTTYLDAKPTQARPHVDRALAHFALREFEKCIADMDQALKLDPNTHLARYWRAMARIQLGASAAEVIPDVEAFLAQQRPPHPDLAKAKKLLELLKKKR